MEQDSAEDLVEQDSAEDPVDNGDGDGDGDGDWAMDSAMDLEEQDSAMDNGVRDDGDGDWAMEQAEGPAEELVQDRNSWNQICCWPSCRRGSTRIRFQRIHPLPEGCKGSAEVCGGGGGPAAVAFSPSSDLIQTRKAEWL